MKRLTFDEAIVELAEYEVPHREQTFRVLSSNSLIGERVTDDIGDCVGTLKELMIDLDTGRVAFAIICVGEVDERRFAVSWNALQFSLKEQKFILTQGSKIR